MTSAGRASDSIQPMPEPGRTRVRRWLTGSAVLSGVAVAVAGLLVTALAARWLAGLDAQRYATKQLADIEHVTDVLRSRMDDYAGLARAMAGLFDASTDVSHEEWLRYAATSGVDRINERGGVGIIFAPRVDALERAPWMAPVSDPGAAPGETSHRIGAALPVQYFSPPTSELSAWVGHDLVADAAERDAVVLAIAARRPVLSAPVSLGSPGAWLVMPVNQEGRDNPDTDGALDALDTLRGVVGVAIRYDDWVGSALAGWETRFGIRLVDPAAGSAQALVQPPAGMVPVGAVHTLQFAGRRLQVQFHTGEAAQRSLVATTALSAGGLLSLTLGWLSYVMMRGRLRAEGDAARVGVELAESERRFALATAATSDGIWEWHAGASTVFLSARAQTIAFGQPGEGAVSYRRVLRRLARAERAVLLTALRAHLRQRVPLDVEVNAHAHSERCTLRVRGQAQWDALGRVERVAGAISDVTALRAREREIDQVRAFHARVLEIFPYPLLIKSRDHRYLFVNQAACDFIGQPREALLDACVGDLLPEQEALHHALDDEVVEGGGAVSREFHVRARDGREGDLVVSKAAVEGIDGQTVVLAVLSDVSPLRSAERRLRASLAELDGLFANSPLGMAMVSRGGEIRRANAAFARIVGRTEAALIGQSYQSMTPERFHQLDREKTVDALRRGSVTPYERAFVRPDGTEVAVVLSGALVRGSDGEPGVWTVVEDISERKAAEEALRRMNATNKSMLDAIPDILVQFDAQLRFIAFRASEHEALRIDPRSVMGQPLEEIISPRRYALVAPLFHEAMRRRQGQQTDYSAFDACGTLQHYEARISPVGTGGVLLLLRNVTEQYQREAALRESESRFRLLADSAPVIIWLADEEFAISYVNRRWFDVTGASREQTYGRAWMQFIHPDETERVQQAMDEARAAHGGFDLELRFRRVDGGYAMVKLTVAAQTTEGGDFVGFIGCGMDVTALRLANVELARHRDHLSELVGEQTAHVLAAKEAAERANEAKTLFLANMSHELRSPMHAVLSYARLGEQRTGAGDTDRAQDYFHRIRVSGERLLVLVNDLLDLSKLEARRMVLDRQMCDAGALVKEVLREFEGLGHARHLRLHCHVAQNTPRLSVDAARLLQLIRNLVSNAVKFSPEHAQVWVEIRPDTIAHAGRMVPAVTMSVCDQGPGIPADELESVFDKFVQSSKTRTGAGGTGLGLAICREIASAHGGRIHAENMDNGGARFVVTIPAAVTDPSTPEDSEEYHL